MIDKIKRYFAPHELVGRRTFEKFGSKSFGFFDDRLLEALFIIRNELEMEITVNNWHRGGGFSQRGLRSNIQPICKKRTVRNSLYLSSHTLGKGVDFDVKGMRANEVRKWIKDNAFLFDFKIRLERKYKGKYINWVHLDVMDLGQSEKVHFFDV